MKLNDVLPWLKTAHIIFILLSGAVVAPIIAYYGMERTLAAKISQVREDLAKNYISRDSFQDLTVEMRKVRTSLNRIEGRLEIKRPAN